MTGQSEVFSEYFGPEDKTPTEEYVPIWADVEESDIIEVSDLPVDKAQYTGFPTVELCSSCWRAMDACLCEEDDNGTEPH